MRILLFTGDGKGKTTAALGMALRAQGHGMRVCMIQFVKADADVGEVRALSQALQATIVQTGLGFLPKPTDARWADHRAAAEAGLRQAAAALASGPYDLVILDEVCLAVERGLLKESDVVDAVRAAAPTLCVVLTGRGATPGLIALADTVTDMHCVKHGMQRGIPAQKGVER